MRDARPARSGHTPAQEEHRRLLALINHLPALIGYWDRELRNVIANDAYVEFFGVTPGEARGRHVREILGEALYELNKPFIEGVLAGKDQLFERTLIDSRGVTRYTQASYVADIVDDEVLGFYVQVTDVTPRVEAEHARDEARRLFEISMTNAPIGKVVLTRAARILQINPAMCAALSYLPEELLDSDFRRLVHPDELASAEADLVRMQDGSVKKVASERRYVRRDGSIVWMLRSAVYVSGAYGGDDVIVAQFQDVTARRHAEAELSRLALTDSLTGLHNRHALNDHMHRIRAEDPSTAVGIIFLDLDGFKHVNDNFGHAVGDAVLVRAAGLLAGLVIAPNSAYRFGGDEFVVVVLDARTERQVAAVAGDVRAALTGTYPTTTIPLELAATVGWTWGDAADGDELLRQADANMYRLKRQRGNASR